MASPNIPNTNFSAGALIKSSEHNANWAAFTTWATGNIQQDNFGTLSGALTWSISSNLLAISSANTGTEGSAKFTHTGVLASGKSIVWVTSNVGQTTGDAAVNVELLSAGASIPAIKVSQAGTGSGIWISHTGAPASGKAALQVDSTTGGVLLPRMTTSQIGAITNLTEGLEAYDTTLHRKAVYNGTGFVPALDDRAGANINGSLAAAIASNILTVNLKDRAGNDPTVQSPAVIGFRNSTLTTGTYNLRNVTASLSVALGTTVSLGLPTATSSYIYIFALDNAGTVELYASAHPYLDEALLQSTSTTGTSNQVLFGANARSSMPVRLLGRVKATWTSGTGWSSITEIANVPIASPAIIFRAHLGATSAFASSGATQQVTGWTIDQDTINSFASNAYTVAAPGKYRITVVATFVFNAEGSLAIAEIQKNSTAVARGFANGTVWGGGGSNNLSVIAHHEDSFVANDTIKFFATQQNASAANRNIVGEAAGTSSYFIVERIGQ